MARTDFDCRGEGLSYCGHFGKSIPLGHLHALRVRPMATHKPLSNLTCVLEVGVEISGRVLA